MDDFSSYYADLIVIAVVAISGLLAFVRGFVQEFLSLAAWIAAGIATFLGIDYVIPLARQLTTIQPLADIGAGTVIFLGVLVVLTVLTRLLVRRVRRSGLGALDRSLGLLFGLFRGALLIAVAWVVVAWTFQEEEYPDWITEARTLPLVQQGALALYDLVPEYLRPEDPPTGLEPDSGKGGLTFESLREIVPKAAAPEERSGYKEQERKDLQGLVEQNQ